MSKYKFFILSHSKLVVHLENKMNSKKYWFNILLFFIFILKVRAGNFFLIKKKLCQNFFPKKDFAEDCRNSIFGCCPDGITAAAGQNYENCDMIELDENCSLSEYGCCSDGQTAADGPNQEGCSDHPCEVINKYH